MRRHDCVHNLDPISVLWETPADDNEVRILECQALVLRTAGTQALHEGFFQEHVVVDSRCEAA